MNIFDIFNTPQVNKDLLEVGFPVLLFENFIKPSKKEREIILEDIISKKVRTNNNENGTHNWPVEKDYNKAKRKMSDDRFFKFYNKS